jgi:hypothetical protein
MTQRRSISEPPTWEELLKAMAPDAQASLREEMKVRLKMTTSSDEAVLGARDFLEDHQYDFDALRQFISPELTEHKDLTSQSPRRYFPLIYKISTAAAIIAGLFYGSILLQSERRHRQITESIFYEPGMPVFAGLGGDKIFHEMMTCFRLQESAEGLRYIDTLEQLYNRNDTLSYFAGWLHYFEKDYASAARRFKEVTEETGSVYHEKSELMTAASLLLADQKDAARVKLEAILKQSAHGYRKEAEDLLRVTGD